MQALADNLNSVDEIVRESRKLLTAELGLRRARMKSKGKRTGKQKFWRVEARHNNLLKRFGKNVGRNRPQGKYLTTYSNPSALFMQMMERVGLYSN